MENKWVSRKQLEKDIEKGIFITKNSVKCKHCGHSMLIGRKEKIICNWCGHYVFKDDKKEFMYRMRGLI